MSKTAYEIETELKGSGANRTGFGGRPELINFYMDNSGESADVSMVPALETLEINALRCGKEIPVLTKLGADGASKTSVCGVEVTISGDAVATVVFKDADGDTLTFTVASGEWAFAAAETETEPEPAHDPDT